MKKIYSLLFIAITSLSFGQAFTATYDFASIPSSATNGTTDPTTPPSVAGLSFNNFTATVPSAPATFTGSSGAGRFSYPNQPTGATNADNNYANLTGSIDLTNYFEFTVTPNAGTTYDLTSVTFRHQRSGTGPRTYAVRSSRDSYASNLAASINPANAELSVQAGNVFFRVNDANTAGQNGSTITLDATNFSGLTGPVTFRFYSWNAEASTGTTSIDDVAVIGNISALSSASFSQIDGLKMYPNPAKNNLFIETALNSDINVSVVDMLGKEVLNTKVVNNTVNVSNLTSGIYIVKITEEGKTSTKKLIIE